jgi:hypothetical protein
VQIGSGRFLDLCRCMRHDHPFWRLALGPGRLRQGRRDYETAACFHQSVAHEAELGFLARLWNFVVKTALCGKAM